MRIAYFCQYFVPETAAPSARVSELSFAWAEAGHDVTVVTGLPNHPTGRVPDEYRGVVFRRERLGPISVWRNWIYATPNEGFFKKTLSHLSFMTSTLLLSVPRLRKMDVLVVSSPTFFVVMTVCVAHWIWRIPYVFEVRDLWPGVFVELGVIRQRWLIRLLEAVEMFLYRRAALVVVVTDSFRDTLLRRGVASEKVRVITNGVDLERFTPAPDVAVSLRETNGLGTSFVVLYIGAHGISHALSSVLDVAKAFADEPAVRFVFVGDGAAKRDLVRKAEEQHLTNVDFLPSQPRDTMPGWYSCADVALVPLRNVPTFETFIPSKMFEIMACERPIVASVKGEARQILERSGSALIVDPEDVHGIATSIRRLLGDAGLRRTLGARGGVFVDAHYNRRMLAGRYLTLLQDVTHGMTA